MSEMTKAERNDLAKLVRQREKIAKSDVDLLATERLADFEKQAASLYRADDDAVWAEQKRIARQAAEDANIRIAERSRELGVPEWTAPSMSVVWYSRGQNASKDRVAELRRVAKTRVDANAKAAKLEIERTSVDIQTQLVADGLESEAARNFLATMPTPQQLMPSISITEIEAVTRDA